jgi:hypothetical protein
VRLIGTQGCLDDPLFDTAFPFGARARCRAGILSVGNCPATGSLPDLRGLLRGRGEGWIPTGRACRWYRDGALGRLRAGRSHPRDGDRRRGGRPIHTGLRRHRVGSSGSPTPNFPARMRLRPRPHPCTRLRVMTQRRLNRVGTGRYARDRTRGWGQRCWCSEPWRC